MKNLLIFIAGAIMGAILVVLFSLFVTAADDHGVVMFDEPGDYIQGNRFEVLQEVYPGAALAHAEDRKYGISSFTGVLVLFVNDDGKRYYDEEIIKIPAGKRVRQIGIYKYESKAEILKTVPVVRIE